MFLVFNIAAKGRDKVSKVGRLESTDLCPSIPSGLQYPGVAVCRAYSCIGNFTCQGASKWIKRSWWQLVGHARSLTWSYNSVVNSHVYCTLKLPGGKKLQNKNCYNTCIPETAMQEIFPCKPLDVTKMAKYWQSTTETTLPRKAPTEYCELFLVACRLWEPIRLQLAFIWDGYGAMNVYRHIRWSGRSMCIFLMCNLKTEKLLVYVAVWSNNGPNVGALHLWFRISTGTFYSGRNLSPHPCHFHGMKWRRN